MSSACVVGSDPFGLSTPKAGRTCRTGSHSSLSQASCAGAGAGARAAGAGAGAFAGVGVGAGDGAGVGAIAGRQSRQNSSKARRSSGVTLPKTCPTRRARSCTRMGSSGRADAVGGAAALASPAPTLGAGVSASPMRTPLPCGSKRGRADAFDVAPAAVGGIAAGAGGGGSGAGVGDDAGCRLKVRSSSNVPEAQASRMSPSSYASSSTSTRWRCARECCWLRVGPSSAGGPRDRRSADRAPVSAAGGAGASASRVSALGAGMCASPMRTPLPCGSNCGRAVAPRATPAAGGGIAAGGGSVAPAAPVMLR